MNIVECIDVSKTYHQGRIEIHALNKVNLSITKGEFVVRQVDRIDEKKRQIWFRASGRNADQDPYLIHFYRVNFDGSGLVALTAGNGNHSIQYSPDRKYIDVTIPVGICPFAIAFGNVEVES